MSVVYESRISLDEFWCKLQSGGGMETVSTYLKRKLSGSLALSTLKLQSKRSHSTWFLLRLGKGKQVQDIPITRDSLVTPDTLDRVAFELGWIDSSEWEESQVSWRLDWYEARKPLSVCGYVVVASRQASERRFCVTDDDKKGFTWIPLAALFPDLPKEAKFVGWKRAAADAKKLQLENVDESCMFEKLFPPIYRDYVRTLLHLPIAVGSNIVKTVDFRNAEPKAFHPLLLRSDTYSPDTMFHAMVTFRVEIGVSKNGKMLALPRLPSRQVVTKLVRITRSDILEGADIVPVECSTGQPNWYISFPLVNSLERYRLNLATLEYLDPFTRSNFVQKEMFPHSPKNLPIGIINRFFTWRMKWTYAFAKPLVIACKSPSDHHSVVFVSLLKPWY